MIEMKPGDLILFEPSDHDQIMEQLDHAGYRFHHGGRLTDSWPDKYGIRFPPQKTFPNCLSTLSSGMARNIREYGFIGDGDFREWNVYEYIAGSLVPLNGRGSAAVEVGDLL